ncbi:hypothetical protein H4R99_006163, partial [Coemansia sp. RSA 1722]
VLKQHGFQVYLIDEFRSSSICPVCNHGLATFRYVRNPRSWQLDSNPWVKCHGLLRCQNENCLESVAGPKGFKPAVLNLKHILVGLREEKCIPERFSRKTPKEKAIPKPKTKSTKAQSWAEYKRKEKRKAKREAKREANAAALPKQLSAKRLFADVDSSGSDDEVPKLKAKCDYKDDAIQKAEAYLSDFSGRSVDFDRYSAYLRARGEKWDLPRFHEPIRGVGMRRMLWQQGFEVYLLDEYLTSKTCPKCNQKSLENFRYARNPRPRKRSKYPTVRVHGLLRCTSEACTKVVIRDSEQTKWHRMWNRDLAAVLNFKTILEGPLYKN